MNLSFSSKPLNSTSRKTGALAKVYTKDGRSIRVPLRPAQSATCATCSQHPERQFMRWFTWQSAANPGFPVMVKSILLIGNQTACSNCQRQLTRFLNRFSLANRLRLGLLQPGADADQQRVSAMYSWGFDDENDQELSRYRRSGSVGRSSATQRRAGAAKPPTSLRRRRSRSVVRILRRPPVTIFQNPLPIPVADAEPTYITPSPSVEEPVVEGPMVEEPVIDEPVADSQEPPAPADEMSLMNGYKRRPVGMSASASSPVIFTSEAAGYLRLERGLSHLANRIKGRGQMKGATVEIVLARLADGRKILVAGINSSATWTPAQLAELRRLSINVAPQTARGMERAPHAEENMAAHLITLRARGERWSRAVVGAGGSYVCSVCRTMIARVGGRIE